MARKFYKENIEKHPAIAFELSAPEGFVEITDTDTLQQLHNEKYLERESDGHDYFSNFRTKIYIKILDGTYTEQEVFDLETLFSDLESKLINGNWMTAKAIVYNLPLQGIFDQEMKDDIYNYVTDYVDRNY